MIMLVLDGATQKMDEAVAHTRREFSTVRTGRASSGLVERLTVDAYGVEMRMQELASFSVPEARQLLIAPHDPGNVPAIEKAIMKADLGLTPSSDGRTIRLVFPDLTEERRRDLVRMINTMAEEGKNHLRGLRRGARKDLDDYQGEGHVSEDDIKWAESQLDDLIHSYEGQVEQARSAKEDELLEV
ncbi:MAG: ribosome recycling factor [Acidimicrobiia bacterium]|nr:ribosome recycling factor [Actinomycetota bacterium]MBL6923886.1 ribosome recycling factor [Acidimicrobiia bacterium]MBL6926377.1 ribosome recycling factor [Acidimicrobiia bacterium]